MRPLLPLLVALAPLGLAACRSPASSSGTGEHAPGPAGPESPRSEAPAAGGLLLLSGGTVYTDVASPPVEALLIRNGQVLLAGSRAALERRAEELAGDARRAGQGLALRRIDLRGGVAIPGLQDAHGHLESLGESLESVDLLEVPSLEELIERVAARAAHQPAGSWIVGRGWDQTRWPGQQFPEHAALSARVPDHPVYLERVDGHAAFVNARALEVAGLVGPGRLPEVEGGRIVLDAAGRPSGVLVDAATGLVSARIPPPDAATRERFLLAAQERLLSQGVTCVHDMGTSDGTIDALRALEASGRLRLRVLAYLWANEGLSPRAGAFLAETRRRDEQARGAGPAPRLRVIGAKLMVDGALGSRGAALLAPYADAPGETGLLQLTPEVFAARLHEVVSAGLQPATHAIGDRGNRLVLDAYQAELERAPGLAALRPRIEHAQVVAARDWARFAELGVIPSMQPTHATSDMRWAEARLGPERVLGAYAWRRLASPRTPLAFGSDFPVESSDPRLGLYAARTRQDPSGQPPGGWFPGQRLDAASALAGFTSGAAFAAREEATRGHLRAGASADVTVLDLDPLRCEPARLLDAHVLLTLIDGEPVHTAPGVPHSSRSSTW